MAEESFLFPPSMCCAYLSLFWVVNTIRLWLGFLIALVNVLIVLADTIKKIIHFSFLLFDKNGMSKSFSLLKRLFWRGNRCFLSPANPSQSIKNEFVAWFREISSSLCSWYNVKELGGNSRRRGNFRVLSANKVGKRKKAATQPAEGSGCLCKYEDVA